MKSKLTLAVLTVAAVLVFFGGTTLLNLTNQVTGTLPHGNGGTDVTAPGSAGHALRSNGSSWASAQIDFSDLSGSAAAGQLPNPSSSTLGGVESFAAVTHQWIRQISTSGVPTASQPACGDLSDAAASCNTDATNASNIGSGTLGAGRLPNPSSSTLGGIESFLAVTHQWIRQISTSGVPTASQPACGDLSDAAASCNTDATNASNIGSGTLAAARMASEPRRRAIPFTIGDPNNSSALGTTSVYTDYVTVPFACTIVAYNLVIDGGTITVKFWKVATGTAIPTSSNSISTSGVGISSGTAIHSTTTSDFTTTTVSDNDIMAMNVTAAATAKYVNGVLECDQ